MLDDQNVLADRDPSGTLDLAARLHEQLEHDFKPLSIDGGYENIAIGGMGGSALSGLVTKNWLSDELKIPLEILRNYDLPAYIGKDTLFIASSYSGNTEETLAMFNEAQKRKATVVAVSHGGRLTEAAEKNNIPVLALPEILQPRYSIGYGLKATIHVLESSGTIEGKMEELNAARKLLKTCGESWGKESPLNSNETKQLAVDLAGKTPVIYSGSTLSSAAYKWKININENAKNVAFCNELPEFNHNEFIGWTSHPIEKPFGIIELVSPFDNERVRSRFEVSNRLLSGRWPHPAQVHVKGENQIQQLLWAILFGDFVSLYLAVLNGVNPEPVELIEKFKKELG